LLLTSGYIAQRSWPVAANAGLNYLLPACKNCRQRKLHLNPLMDTKKGSIDIINEVLEACILAYPVSSFIISLYKQYISRGWLTKGQLQGLFAKAQKIQDLTPGKLAALEALINKMPNRTKSEAPKEAAPLYQRDESAGQLIEAILAKYPQHKRVLFLQAKYNNNEPLSPADLADLKRFGQLLK
jgi:hypothetical protein